LALTARQAHGVAGATTRTRSSRRRAGRTTSAANSTTPATTTTTPRRRRSRAVSNSDRSRTRDGGSVDRDALLQALFPNGIPAKENVLRAINTWLDDAERLAQLK